MADTIEDYVREIRQQFLHTLWERTSYGTVSWWFPPLAGDGGRGICAPFTKKCLT